MSQTKAGRGRHEILVIDDDPLLIDLISDALEGRDFSIHGVTDPQTALSVVAERRPRIVVLDLVMPSVTGLELLEEILRIDPGIDVFLLTGHYSTESAVEAIQKGACDYLRKPLSISVLQRKLDKWLADFQISHQSQRLDDELVNVFQLEGIVGRSPAMLEMFSRMERIAPHFQTALVTGETGTGKERVARALHNLGPRPSSPFIVCNCAAIPEHLFESELFGHVRGSFTSATGDKRGLVEAAAGGTLFLDEITEIPLAVQAKLLRLLQNREIQRVGAPTPKRVDLRIVAATNRDLKVLVDERKLREDLYYRLAMVEVTLPRLSERMEDLPLLLRHFLDMYAQKYEKPPLRLSMRAQGLLHSYTWPGNVRELENVISWSAMMARKDMIEVHDLPDSVRLARETKATREDLCTMEEMEIRHALYVLERVGGNRVKAAKVLAIGRATLYRLLSRHQQVSSSVLNRASGAEGSANRGGQGEWI